MPKWKDPKRILFPSLVDITDLARRFRKDASAFAKKLPDVDAEDMAQTMASAAVEYAKGLELHLEGNRRAVLKQVADVAAMAEKLLNAIFELGPKGRNIVFGENLTIHALVNDERTKWLFDLIEIKNKLRKK